MRLKPAAITPDKLYNNIKNNQNKCISFGVSENIKQNKDVFEKSDKIEKPSVKNTNTIKEEIKDGVKQSSQAGKDDAPVFFDYDQQNPKVRKKIHINFSKYKNLAELTQDYFYKYINESVNSLGEFAYTLEWEKEGHGVEIPNCILIEDPADKIADDLIKMTKDMSDVEYAAVEGKEGLAMLKEVDAQMETAKAKFKKTGRRTLLKVDNFDKICMQGLPFEIGEYMKSVTTSCADDYGTTIIFKTKSSHKILSEILEPHRCGIICKAHNYSNAQLGKIAEEQIAKEAPALTKLIEKEQEEINRPKNAQKTTPEVETAVPEKPSVKNTNTIKEEIKDGIKQSAQKLEDAAKKELLEIKSEITANLPGKRIGNKFKKIFFLIIAPLGAITGAAVKFKDKILIFLKGLKNENNSNSGTEQK